MDPFSQISTEVDRFYERSMRLPDFVLVGLRGWTRMEQFADRFRGVNDARWFVHTAWGKVEVRRHPTYYSMIAPVLEKMP